MAGFVLNKLLFLAFGVIISAELIFMAVLDFKSLLDKYIEEHFVDEDNHSSPLLSTKSILSFALPPLPEKVSQRHLARPSPADVNFQQLYSEKSGETFSSMLLRLIDETGKKSSEIYSRALVDRRLFSKIANNIDYKPSKQTALAFAFALRLNFSDTQKLLATAGFTLSNSSLFDVIISFFLEYEIFDIDSVNHTLYEYHQPLLGC